MNLSRNPLWLLACGMLFVGCESSMDVDEQTAAGDSEADVVSDTDCNARKNPIRCENQKKSVCDGARYPACNFAVQKNVAKKFAAFATSKSVEPGGRIIARVGTLVPRDVTWAIHRMGYYDGKLSRAVTANLRPTRIDPKSVRPGQAVDDVGTQCTEAVRADVDATECSAWMAMSVTIPVGAVTGVYVLKLAGKSVSDGTVEEANFPFVVGDAQYRAPVGVQVSTLRWQAYNGFGGHSMYDAGKFKYASFSRPYLAYNGLGDLPRELDFIRWIEKRGINAGYMGSLDTDRDPRNVSSRKLWFSIGHDEYWTQNARKNVEAAQAQGTSLGFVSGNEGYWKVTLSDRGRLEPRMMVDRPGGKDLFRNQAAATPRGLAENRLQGIQYSPGNTHGVLDSAGRMRVVYMPLELVPGNGAPSWLFAGIPQSDLVVPNVVGEEWDGCIETGPANARVCASSPNGYVFADHERPIVVGRGQLPTTNIENQHDSVDWTDAAARALHLQQMTYYKKGNSHVLSAGSIAANYGFNDQQTKFGNNGYRRLFCNFVNEVVVDAENACRLTP